MCIQFDLLSGDHGLVQASEALKFIGQGRLVARADRYAISLTSVAFSSESDIADAYAQHLGYQPLGMPWSRVPQENLRFLLSVLVSKDMAYDVEVANFCAAELAVSRWIAAFLPKFSALTNGDLLFEHAKDDSAGAAFNPIVGATFETGVVIVGAGEVGILWAMDED